MASIEGYAASTVPVLADLLRRVLGESGLIALPTESFYGLAVAPFDEQALAKLWHIKGRSQGKPILVLIGDRSQLEPFVRSVPRAADVLINAFWPGPLTIVFAAAHGLSNAVTAGTGSVGIRLSAWQPLVDLLRRVGPVTGTSANREGLPGTCANCAVSTALAASRDRLFIAAWAPIASDTMPTNTAPMVSERLDTLSCRGFMRFSQSPYGRVH